MIPEYGRTTSAKAEDVGQIRELAERYSKSLNEKGRPLLPLISFYGGKAIGRQRGAEKADQEKPGYH